VVQVLTTLIESVAEYNLKITMIKQANYLLSTLLLLFAIV